MKSMTVILSLLLSWNLLAADPSFQVKTIDGIVVNVDAQEIKRAYMLMITKARLKTNASKYEVNDDGSVTIYDPYYRFDGRVFKFRSSGSQICRFFGFQNIITLDGEHSLSAYYVYLDPNGSVNFISSKPYNSPSSAVLVHDKVLCTD